MSSNEERLVDIRVVDCSEVECKTFAVFERQCEQTFRFYLAGSEGSGDN